MLAALARMRGFAGDAAQARYICSLEALLAPRAENSKRKHDDGLLESSHSRLSELQRDECESRLQGKNSR